MFINAQSIITQTNLPLSVHVYRVVWRNFIIFGHNALIFPVVAVLLAPPPSWTGLLAAPGLVLLYLNGIWTGLLLGLASARFRDVPPIVDSILRILFFITPVIWMPEFLPERIALLDWNPFFHFLEVVRAPLLGSTTGAAFLVDGSRGHRRRQPVDLPHVRPLPAPDRLLGVSLMHRGHAGWTGCRRRGRREAS